VTAASWFQLAAAGLIVVQAVVEAISAVQFRRLFGDAFGGWSPLSFGVLLALAAWLAVTAFGLRRGSRAAYWLSLAGLVFPVLSVVLASALGLGTTYSAFAYVAPGTAGDATALVRWAVLSDLVTGAVLVVAAALVAGTVAMLTTGASRRYFA
jgi:hypothetical protein